MARRLGQTPFAELLANSLAQDETAVAMADSLDEALAKSVRAIPDDLIYARLAQPLPDRAYGSGTPLAGVAGVAAGQLAAPMARLAAKSGGLAAIPEPLLDLLAWQFHVDGYEAAGNYGAKLALLQKSLLLHRRKGTAWAVRNALESTFQTGVDLSEWFQYGGKPYFFRVGIDISEIEWTEKSLPDAFRLIFEYKNVRSWLEWLTTRWKKKATRVIGAITKGDTSLKSCLYFAPKKAPGCGIFNGFALTGNVRAKYTVLQMPDQVLPLRKYSGQAVSGATWTRIPPCWPDSRADLRLYSGAAQNGLTRSAIRFYSPETGTGPRLDLAAAQNGFTSTSWRPHG